MVTMGYFLMVTMFTRLKKERFDFDGGSGDRVYFCLLTALIL
jgi:hypothetical protein